MKKIIRISSLMMLLFVVALQGCKKYTNGPVVSFRTRSERLANTWKVDNYKKNGTDYTSLVTNYTETFSKNGAYAYDWSLLSGSGTWKFQSKDEEVKLTGSDGQSSRTLTILKLEEKSFWYSTVDGNDSYEYHMIAK